MCDTGNHSWSPLSLDSGFPACGDHLFHWQLLLHLPLSLWCSPEFSAEALPFPLSLLFFGDVTSLNGVKSHLFVENFQISLSILISLLGSRNFLKDFIYLFSERGEGKERERNINVWLSLMCPLLHTQPATQACALTRNWTGDPLVHAACAQSTERHQPGLGPRLLCSTDFFGQFYLGGKNSIYSMLGRIEWVLCKDKNVRKWDRRYWQESIYFKVMDQGL